MTDQTQTQGNQLDDIVADADTGGRAPKGWFDLNALWYIPLVWSLFQLWIASPLSYMPDTQSRAIHLAFAVFLAFIAFPGLKSSPRHKVPLATWAIALIAAATASYLWWNNASISAKGGFGDGVDIWVAAVGIVLLLEAGRRSLGLPLALVAIFALLYVFFGSWSGLPDAIQWKGASLRKAMSHMWLTTEGVFGVALRVSSQFVFLFVLFGALLNKAGAGSFFLRLAFAALGHLRGGPAKAAVVASAATGLISGSSIANVVTTGTFTIPLMKRVGFSATKAGAVEVSSSINGVLTPPVMGAVAFLMTEYVGIPYVEVVKTAILPAAISYVALVYIVHLEALKAQMKGTSRMHPAMFLLGAALIIVSTIIIATALLMLLGQIVGFIYGVAGAAAIAIVLVLMAAAYLVALYFVAQEPDLAEGADIMDNLPPVRTILKTGIHYLLPLLMLFYLLMIERKSAGNAAFWTTIAMVVILLTQHPIKAMFRGEANWAARIAPSFQDLTEGLVEGARNMIGLAAAMAVAGIISGTVSLTGIGLVMAEFVEYLSGGRVLLMLIFVALVSIILGMGVPTTANYIIVSSLMAGVVVELGAQSGLAVPLIAVHMFVFYFGIMADVTPPVGLASFAAAAISKGDPLRTGFQAFFYSIRTALLPFLFIFNTDLLLIDVGPYQAVFVFIVALIAMLLFAAGTMNYFMVKSRLWESAALLLAAFILFQPGYFLNKIAPEFETRAGSDLYAMAEAAPADASLRVRLRGENLNGDLVDARYLLPLGAAGADGQQRLLDGAGIEFRDEGGTLFVDGLNFGGPSEQLGIDWDWEVVELEVPADRMPKELFYIPALLLVGGVYLLQMRRRRSQPEEAQA